jgi:hypothetical protein
MKENEVSWVYSTHGKERNACKVWYGNLKEGACLEDLGVDGATACKIVSAVRT